MPNADISALAQRLSDAAGMPFQAAASEIIRQGARAIQQDAQQRAPKKTGALASSITVTFDGPLTARIGPTVKYGVFQEYGTGIRGERPTQPYDIYPKRPDGWLVFEIDGKVIRTRHVRHPGIPAHPYMRPAAQNYVDNVANQIAAMAAARIAK